MVRVSLSVWYLSELGQLTEQSLLGLVTRPPVTKRRPYPNTNCIKDSRALWLLVSFVSLNTTKNLRHRSCKQAAEHRTICLQANASDWLGHYLATRELNWSARVYVICRQDENRREKCSILARPTFRVSRGCGLGTRLIVARPFPRVSKRGVVWGRDYARQTPPTAKRRERVW